MHHGRKKQRFSQKRGEQRRRFVPTAQPSPLPDGEATARPGQLSPSTVWGGMRMRMKIKCDGCVHVGLGRRQADEAKARRAAKKGRHLGHLGSGGIGAASLCFMVGHGLVILHGAALQIPTTWQLRGHIFFFPCIHRLHIIISIIISLSLCITLHYIYASTALG